MRPIIWFVLLFVVAVVAATTLGANDGLVTFYWNGWRLDVSLNLFLFLLVGTCFVLVTVIQGIDSLVGLPRRAREWRVARRDRTAQAALRDALAQYFGGRYTRAQKAAQRALAIQADTPEIAQDNEFTVLAHLLAAGSAHRLQNREFRDAALRQALELARRTASARSAEEGARLLAAEWALDDRDANRAMELLDELPQGVARRTHALRLKLQAARLGRRPQDALRTARLLVKHGAFSHGAAVGLLRSLASESLDVAHDADQLRRIWGLFDAADRRDPFIAARGATRAADLGACEDGRAWVRPLWDQLDELGWDERCVIAGAVVACVAGLPLDWLPRLETAAQQFPNDGAVAFATGCAFAERQLWGKAGVLLERAAADARLPNAFRRHALLTLAEMAARDGDAPRAAQRYEAAARVG
ncbi:heme biosynthesis HemY N-terminal domain-containing protein [Piscinibacter koreensis]|uniref:Heme biosynthesis protein HemY n=1 Tax=Piscinibacter koreensis TaxID=2742824 RepID=A0A7Y6NMN1_9BURK|nr:heme biosynthesis HemY N-terminal domain-containing protein [Schlegelella koreensis]NUZ05970.1 heme biosynthesis protein HemY [Schlegelella koreensis]